MVETLLCNYLKIKINSSYDGGMKKVMVLNLTRSTAPKPLA